MTYKLTPPAPNESAATVIIRLEDNAAIPINDNNIDYQKYLAWVEEGNTPLPAEE